MDRALTTNSWLELFPLVKLYNLESSLSDHSPIMLVPEIKEKLVMQRKFKFKNAWLMESMCRQLVMKSWEDGINVDFQTKLGSVGNLCTRGEKRLRVSLERVLSNVKQR